MLSRRGYKLHMPAVPVKPKDGLFYVPLFIGNYVPFYKVNHV
jgi:hypothetical protein